MSKDHMYKSENYEGPKLTVRYISKDEAVLEAVDVELSNSNIDQIYNLLRYNSHIKHFTFNGKTNLELVNVELTNERVDTIYKLSKYTPNMKHIVFNNVSFGNASKVLQLIIKNTPKIEFVNCNFMQNMGGVFHILSGILENSKLELLSIKDCIISDDQLKSIKKSCKTKPKLHTLDINESKFVKEETSNTFQSEAIPVEVLYFNKTEGPKDSSNIAPKRPRVWEESFVSQYSSEGNMAKRYAMDLNTNSVYSR